MAKRQFTAIYKKVRQGYIGWIEEVPGVNTQGISLSETKKNLTEALRLVLEVNKLLVEKELKGNVIREPFAVSIS